MAKLDNGPARGTRDLLPAVVARRELFIGRIAECYARFGFRRIETPSIESVERLTGGQGGENEKLIYKILKRGLPESLQGATFVSELTDLGLRFDLTVPLTRFYANNQAQLSSPFRALQIGNVWRAERPGRARDRQFTQCDIDTIGDPSVLAECEQLEATVAAFGELGIRPIKVRLNDRRLLSAIAASAGIGDEQLGDYFIVLDRLDRDGWDEVSRDLGERGVGTQAIDRTRALVEDIAAVDEPATSIERIAELLPAVAEPVVAGLRETAEVLQSLAAVDDGVSFELDPTVVRGMGYYTGQIFEVAHPSSPSSIAGGGRYDDLVGRSLGKPVAACGISVGFDRAVELAEMGSPDLGIALLYGEEAPSVALRAARQLRASGLTVTLLPRRKAMRQQLDALEAEGFTGFATVEDGVASAVRVFGPER